MATKFIFAVASLFLLVSSSLAGERPNVVVFLVDDMGLMDSSVPFLADSRGEPRRYPLNDFYRTPAMERLASQGIRFSDFYAMSVCSPSRVSILTGQNAARHHTTQWISPEGKNGGPLAPPDWNWRGLARESVTLPRLLQSAGYRTIHVGKAHFGPFKSEGDDPTNLGFDVNVGGRAIGAPGSYFGKDRYGNGRKRRADRGVPHLEAYHDTDTHLSDALTLESLKHVREAVNSDQPFFLHLAHYAVHSPHQSDPRFASNYSQSDKPARAKAFATLIEGIDKSLGDLLDGLKEMGVAKETLILFLGDNGSDAPLGHQHAVASSAPLRGKKGAHYEGGVRAPLIVAWAERDSDHPTQKRLPIADGAMQTQMASVCDLFPTIAQVASADAPEGHIVDGRSLDLLLTAASDPNHSRQFLMHYPHAPHRSTYYTTLRDGDWKVAYHYYPGADSNGKRYQLFHLGEDPFEQSNLADSRPEQLQAMMHKLIESLEKHGAQYPLDKRDKSKRFRPVLPTAVE